MVSVVSKMELWVLPSIALTVLSPFSKSSRSIHMSEREQFTELELGCVHNAGSLEKRDQTNTAEKSPLVAEESRFIELNLESCEEAESAKKMEK